MQLRPISFALLAGIFLVPSLAWGEAEAPKVIRLDKPGLTRGLPVMAALKERASVREWSDREVSRQDLSDLLWAANGVNRPESGKRTAPSALNAQDVDVYVFRKDGAWLYDAKEHALRLVATGDHREAVASRPSGSVPPPAATAAAAPPASPKPGGSAATVPTAIPDHPPGVAPLLLVLVSDISRFPRGDDASKREWAAMDAGIVSENIAIFCAGTGLATRPRAGMNKELIRSLLKLGESQIPVLNHPVGHPAAAP